MTDLTSDWTQVPYIAVRHYKHYTKVFSVDLPMWACKLGQIGAWVILSNSFNWIKIPSFKKKTLSAYAS